MGIHFLGPDRAKVLSRNPRLKKMIGLRTNRRRGNFTLALSGDPHPAFYENYSEFFKIYLKINFLDKSSGLNTSTFILKISSE